MLFFILILPIAIFFGVIVINSLEKNEKIARVRKKNSYDIIMLKSRVDALEHKLHTIEKSLK